MLEGASRGMETLPLMSILTSSFTIVGDVTPLSQCTCALTHTRDWECLINCNSVYLCISLYTFCFYCCCCYLQIVVKPKGNSLGSPFEASLACDHSITNYVAVYMRSHTHAMLHNISWQEWRRLLLPVHKICRLRWASRKKKPQVRETRSPPTLCDLLCSVHLYTSAPSFSLLTQTEAAWTAVQGGGVL